MKRETFILVACVSCAPEGPLLEEMPSAEGEHVLVFADPGLELCADSVRHMDEFVERAATEFGLEVPGGDDRIRFHWIRQDSIVDACGGDVAGCAPNGEIYSLYAPLNHELVHAVVAPLGLPRSLFAEGLAVAYEGLGSGPESLYSLAGLPAVLDLVEAGQVEFTEQRGYRIAGAFVAFLIDRFGIDDFLGVYSAIDRQADQSSIDQNFRDVFGTSLEQSIAEFEALPAYAGAACSQPRFDAKLMECDAPEISWDGVRLTVDRVLSCEQPGSIGPFDDKLVVLHTITISEQGLYELRMRGDEQAAQEFPGAEYFGQAVVGVSLRRCGGCEAGGTMSTWIGSTPRLTELPAGVYSLRLHGPATEAVSMGFTLSRIPGP